MEFIFIITIGTEDIDSVFSESLYDMVTLDFKLNKLQIKFTLNLNEILFVNVFQTL